LVTHQRCRGERLRVDGRKCLDSRSAAPADLQIMPCPARSRATRSLFEIVTGRLVPLRPRSTSRPQRVSCACRRVTISVASASPAAPGNVVVASRRVRFDRLVIRPQKRAGGNQRRNLLKRRRRSPDYRRPDCAARRDCRAPAPGSRALVLHEMGQPPAVTAVAASGVLQSRTASQLEPLFVELNDTMPSKSFAALGGRDLMIIDHPRPVLLPPAP